ncbi:MAG: hypothetical protein HYU39_10605 [Thaumarchaeota archaeon]|nr:hypothetical protein [Nitrososphaerota archaeon]
MQVIEHANVTSAGTASKGPEGLARFVLHNPEGIRGNYYTDAAWKPWGDAI